MAAKQPGALRRRGAIRRKSTDDRQASVAAQQSVLGSHIHEISVSRVEGILEAGCITQQRSHSHSPQAPHSIQRATPIPERSSPVSQACESSAESSAATSAHLSPSPSPEPAVAASVALASSATLRATTFQSVSAAPIADAEAGSQGSQPESYFSCEDEVFVPGVGWAIPRRQASPVPYDGECTAREREPVGNAEVGGLVQALGPVQKSIRTESQRATHPSRGQCAIDRRAGTAEGLQREKKETSWRAQPRRAAPRAEEQLQIPIPRRYRAPKEGRPAPQLEPRPPRRLKMLGSYPDILPPLPTALASSIGSQGRSKSTASPDPPTSSPLARAPSPVPAGFVAVNWMELDGRPA